MQCDRHYAIRRNTTVFGEYESIPRTLVLNLIAWPLLLLLFSLLRKLAWDYGRIALVSRDEERWMSLFFGERLSTLRRRRSSVFGSAESLDRTMKQQDKGFCSWLPAYFSLKDEHIRRKCGNDAVQYLQFQRYLISYAVVICLISLGVILPINFMGSEYDASKFARTTISNLKAGDPQLWIHFLLAVVYLVIALVFMRHFSKNLQFYEDEQASRTLMVTGIPRGESARHLSQLIRKYFKQAYGRFSNAERVRLVDVQFAFDIRRLLDLDLCRTRAKLALLNMSLARPEDQPPPNVDGKLNAINSVRGRLNSDGGGADLHAATNSRQTNSATSFPRFCSEANSLDYTQTRVRVDGRLEPAAMSEAQRINTNEPESNVCRPTMHPYMFGQVLCCNALSTLPCCTCCAEVDAESFYREEVQLYTRECAAEQQRALEKPCGIAFLTFETAQQARSVLMDFRRTSLLATATPRASTATCAGELRVTHWSVRYSPEPNNLLWQNLAVPRVIWWLKAVLLHLAVFAVVFLFTTPSLVVNELRRVDLDARLAVVFERDVSFFAEFVHLLIIVLFSCLLPYFVFYTNQFVGNWTRSTVHLVVMYKSFILLVLMILVLPSIGFASALLFVVAFFRSLFVDKTTESLNQSWRCIFEPSNGAFFVRYVMTAGFIGTTLELLRFADLFLFTMRMLAARSAAERATIRKRATDEFEFGRNYAHQLCVFAVFVTYSIPVPLITPFGVIYIALRYAVDRHNLYFALKPSRIDKHIHTTAINFFMSSLILLQLNVVFYLTTKSPPSTKIAQTNGYSPAFSYGSETLARNGYDEQRLSGSPDLGWQILQVSAIGTFLVTLIVFCGCSMFDWFKNVSPIVYTTRQTSQQSTFTGSDLLTPDANLAHPLQNGIHAHFGDCLSERSRQQRHALSRPASSNSADKLVDPPSTSRNNSAVSMPVDCEVSINGHTPTSECVVLRQDGLRRRDAAFLPSVLLKRYDDRPLDLCNHLAPLRPPQITSSAASLDAANHSSPSPSPSRSAISFTAPCQESQCQAQPSCSDYRASDTKVLIHASSTPVTVRADTTKKSDKTRRSINLSPQSRAGYESITVHDYDDDDDDEEQQQELDNDQVQDVVEMERKRTSTSVSCNETLNRSADDEQCFFSRSRTITGDSFALCPHIMVTAPTPARVSLASSLCRVNEIATTQETDGEAQHATNGNSNGHVVPLAVDEADEAAAAAAAASAANSDPDDTQSQTDDSLVQHSNARHNLAFT